MVISVKPQANLHKNARKRILKNYQIQFSILRLFKKFSYCELMLITNYVVKDGASQRAVDLKETTGVRKQVGPGKEGKCETVIFVEPIVDGATPTALGFKRLEKNVRKIYLLLTISLHMFLLYIYIFFFIYFRREKNIRCKIIR